MFVGNGRRRRSLEPDRNATEYTKFKENIEYTVIMPGEYDNDFNLRDTTDQCRNFVFISTLLAILLALSTVIVSFREIIKSTTSHLCFYYYNYFADMHSDTKIANDKFKEVT